MPRTKVIEDQFKTEPGVITHIPTGARITYYQNVESSGFQFKYAQSGSVLPNGEDYSPDDIEKVAGEIFNRIRTEEQSRAKLTASRV